ncbi:MAG: hypothetical protein M3342_20950 [Bacteroidota bacterium]|nr:hypothetical protein [Flavisolibacter sp.]MDQ3846454.1 hypothetical protein [Bacteroidota bacterium]
MDNRNDKENDAKKINVKDTRRFQAEDNEGHVKGSNQAKFNEQRAQEAEDNDKSDLNKLDSRDEFHDSQRTDL